MIYPSGRIGITLNNHWFEAKDNQTENVEAAERATVFMLGWFADPIFGSGDYPAIMKSMVKKCFHDSLKQSLMFSFS